MTQRQDAVPDGFVLVPTRAIMWLFGEGPDQDGAWFGDGEDDAGRFRKYWWRTKFRAVWDHFAAAQMPQQPAEPATDEAAADFTARRAERFAA